MSFRVAILLAIVAQLAEVVCACSDLQDASWRIPNLMGNMVGFTCSACIPFVLSATIDGSLLKRRWLVYLPAGLFGALCVASVWTGWVFDVSDANIYSRGPLFFLYIVTYVGGLVMLVVADIHAARRLLLGDKVFLLLLVGLFIAGSSIQLFLPDLHVSWQCVTLSLILYYVFERELQFKYDLLTGLFNRSSYTHDIDQGVDEGTTVVVFDVDDFKTVNDTYGHKAGDECLRELASIIDSCFSKMGRCYRIGGDEFVFIGRMDAAAAHPATEEMTQRIRSIRDAGKELPYISFGIGTVGPDGSFADAFQDADDEMYRFKAERNPESRS